MPETGQFWAATGCSGPELARFWLLRQCLLGPSIVMCYDSKPCIRIQWNMSRATALRSLKTGGRWSQVKNVICKGRAIEINDFFRHLVKQTRSLYTGSTVSQSSNVVNQLQRHFHLIKATGKLTSLKIWRNVS